MITDRLPEFLPRYTFVWSPSLGAYRAFDAAGGYQEVTLGSCSCAGERPCVHQLALLAQMEDGAVATGPGSVAWTVARLLEGVEG